MAPGSKPLPRIRTTIVPLEGPAFGWTAVTLTVCDGAVGGGAARLGAVGKGSLQPGSIANASVPAMAMYAKVRLSMYVLRLRLQVSVLSVPEARIGRETLKPPIGTRIATRRARQEPKAVTAHIRHDA
jgi:hypothetical protein